MGTAKPIISLTGEPAVMSFVIFVSYYSSASCSNIPIGWKDIPPLCG